MKAKISVSSASKLGYPAPASSVLFDLLGYLLGLLFFTVAAYALLVKSFVPGFLFLASAFFAIPVFFKFLPRAYSLSGLQRFALAFALAFLATLVFHARYLLN